MSRCWVWSSRLQFLRPFLTNIYTTYYNRVEHLVGCKHAKVPSPVLAMLIAHHSSNIWWAVTMLRFSSPAVAMLTTQHPSNLNFKVCVL